MSANKTCVIVRQEGARKLYWNGLSFAALQTVAERYTLAGAKKKAGALAKMLGVPLVIESATIRKLGKHEKNPVPPSSRAGRKLPANDNVKKAGDLYSRFSGHAPQKKARKVNVPDRAYLRVGTVDGILYTTNRDGAVEQYIHHFRPASRPELLVSHDGKEARTHGGKFTFTERGFVDEDASGRPVE